jgi:PAS domain S-box-containing protein
VRKRPDLNVQHKALALLFAIFITACGVTHVMSIVVLWQPYYDAEGLLKAITALLSVSTAITLPFFIPKLLLIPSPKTLAAEIEAHKATLAQLQATREALAARVRAAEGDLIETARRFETAIKGSPITVFEQDEDFRYTWAYNPPMGLEPADMIGKTEADFYPADTAERIRAVKASAMRTKAVQNAEIQFAIDGVSVWYNLRVEPLVLRDGRSGVIATSADITSLKRQQEHLQVLMSELNHRSKNLLTIVISIVRQTAKVHKVPAEFVARVQDRLRALASAHDVLAKQNWSGADLRAIVDGQLLHQLETFGDKRITIQGEPCRIPPEAAHYVAMALHELGSNAAKYGGLVGDRGVVAIRWDLERMDGQVELRLVWTETPGQPISPPSRDGFGSKILKSLTPAALGGRAALEFSEQGLRYSLTALLPA